jgi:AbrB family looped-hinge helix DNA binding protein
MRTTIDKAGRIVVPKALRDAMRLGDGAELEISLVDGHLEIEVPARDFRLEQRGGIKVAVSDEPLPALTAEAVREVLEGVRR